MDTAERLLQFADKQGFGQSKKGKSMLEFYRQVGVSNGSFKAGRSVGSDNLNKIFAKYPSLNMDWVITGRGEMLVKNVAEISENGQKNVQDVAHLREMLEIKDKLLAAYELQLGISQTAKSKAG